MKKRIKTKLRFQTGASITFALLLFLVCAVICSVIIAAATTSAGRMSGIAEADQRYYAVSSAAELLQALIDGKTVSIVKVEETEYTTTYSSGIASDPVKGTSETRVYIVPNKKASEVVEEDYIVTNLFGNPGLVNDTIPKDAAIIINSGNTLSNRELTLTSTFYSPQAGLDFDALAVTIREDLDANGNITLTIYNANNAKGEVSATGDRYTLVLPFGVDRSVSTSTKTENVSSSAVDENTYTVVTKTTESTITTLVWHLTGIKTNS